MVDTTDENDEECGSMNSFDQSIIEFVNGFAQRSHVFDETVSVLANSPLFKGAVIVALLWWVWFVDDEADAGRRRSALLAVLAASIFAGVFARSLAHALPFRERPVYSPGLDFVVPFGSDFDLDGWSSLPSDHAVLFFALATGLFVARRAFGIFAYAYVTVVICLPRLYLGLHWPTDILAGAVLGIGLGWLGTRDPVQRAVGSWLLPWEKRRPGPFYALLFAVSLEIAVLGADVREILGRFGGP